ncbi:MAG TPA: hypothetical protein DEA55_10430 [Rhodospirillaceae bacterium]|nr:hypothetical protein [Rhodospirillaceae bacterium]
MSDVPVSRILVKLSPKASRNEVKGWSQGPDGKRILKASVTAVPEKGKANAALIDLLSARFGVPKSRISIVRGETDKLKTVEIQGVEI